MSDLSIHSCDEHFNCYLNITRSHCSDRASMAGLRTVKKVCWAKARCLNFMRKHGHVTTQLLKLHTFLGSQPTGLYSARVANAASFRGD